ncbi:MAG: hypothetical protein KA764_08400 [Anaerolineales bacterium]|nr:hypothetical protein [Anaerolineales bacterium]
MTALAYFVTPHGFGHAARAAAVMTALQARRPALAIQLFTTVPEWFFRESVRGPFTYHALATDVGLAQTSPLTADLPETVRRLDALLPFEPERVAGLAAQVRASGCRAVLCDIAALGIAVAAAAGVPSILIENFTWDWIYAGYFAEAPALRAHAAAFRELYAGAAYHIQTTPACAPSPHAALTTAPVARPTRQPRAAVRAQLGVAANAVMVLVTMGGFEAQYDFLDRLAAFPEIVFVLPLGGETTARRGNVLLLPHHTPVYHPDLLAAADAVIGKLGYSTLAEADLAGVPFGFLRRPGFRESANLAAYALDQMAAVEVPLDEFEAGAWGRFLPRLLARPQRAAGRPNGADQIADFIFARVIG